MCTNKIYVLEYSGPNPIGSNIISHFVIVIAAANANIAKEYVKEKIGFIGNPVQLMGAIYPTIWNQTGDTEATIQAKILSNNTCTYSYLNGQ